METFTHLFNLPEMLLDRNIAKGRTVGPPGEAPEFFPKDMESMPAGTVLVPCVRGSPRSQGEEWYGSMFDGGEPPKHQGCLLSVPSRMGDK